MGSKLKDAIVFVSLIFFLSLALSIFVVNTSTLGSASAQIFSPISETVEVGAGEVTIPSHKEITVGIGQPYTEYLYLRGPTSFSVAYTFVENPAREKQWNCPAYYCYECTQYQCLSCTQEIYKCAIGNCTPTDWYYRCTVSEGECVEYNYVCPVYTEAICTKYNYTRTQVVRDDTGETVDAFLITSEYGNPWTSTPTFHTVSPGKYRFEVFLALEGDLGDAAADAPLFVEADLIYNGQYVRGNATCLPDATAVQNAYDKGIKLTLDYDVEDGFAPIQIAVVVAKATDSYCSGYLSQSYTPTWGYHWNAYIYWAYECAEYTPDPTTKQEVNCGTSPCAEILGDTGYTCGGQTYAYCDVEACYKTCAEFGPGGRTFSLDCGRDPCSGECANYFCNPADCQKIVTDQVCTYGSYVVYTATPQDCEAQNGLVIGTDCGQYQWIYTTDLSECWDRNQSYCVQYSPGEYYHCLLYTSPSPRDRG